MMNVSRRLRQIFKRKDGATAIEFAILFLPFSLTIFMIMEIAFLFFVDSTLDSALHKSSRSVRVGIAQTAATPWDLARFKSEVCGNMAYYFKCSERLLVTAKVVTNLASVGQMSPVSNGALSVTEAFDPGESGEHILIQAFLPWDPILPYYGIASARLSDGTFILSSGVLFKNEPF